MNDKIKIEYIEKMKIAANQGNKEDNHIVADSVLCDLLIRLGYSDVVEEFKKIKKWYA